MSPEHAAHSRAQIDRIMNEQIEDPRANGGWPQGAPAPTALRAYGTSGRAVGGIGTGSVVEPVR